MLIVNVQWDLNMGSETELLQDFYISSKEPDIGPVIVGIFLASGFSAPFLFIALLSLFKIFLEGYSIEVVFSISFLVIPIFLTRYTLRKYSTLRLQVNHNEDSIVVERAFQNKVWKRTRKSISEAQILAYHYYIITSSFETEKSIHGNSPISSVGPVIGHITVNEQSDSVHQKYHIHGYSGEGGNWKLEISKLIEGAGHDKAREIAKYIGIEFRDDGEVQPKGLVIG
jgi:hypothetical protein